MFRINASCRKHSKFNNMLLVTLKTSGWKIVSDKEMCKFFADFETMPEAKDAKLKLEREIQTLERQIKPALPYGIVFTNAYWVPTENSRFAKL